jgi:hypothetical protein
MPAGTLGFLGDHHDRRAANTGNLMERFGRDRPLQTLSGRARSIKAIPPAFCPDLAPECFALWPRAERDSDLAPNVTDDTPPMGGMIR